VNIIMEIEKKRETSWKIQIKNEKESIEVTSVEISGEVRQIKFSLINNGNSIKVKMTKEEFYNFLSLMSAFKDVVIGEDIIPSLDEIDVDNRNLEKEQQFSNINISNNNITNLDPKPPKENFEDDDLNPEEWDPW